MKKAVKVTLLSLAALGALALILLITVPPAISKRAEARLREIFARAGIREDRWSVGKVSYVPLFGHLVLDQFSLGEPEAGFFFNAGKLTLKLQEGGESLAAGSAEARDLSLLAGEAGISAKSFSARNFSLNLALLSESPGEALEKLESLSLGSAVLDREGRPLVSLESLEADLDYAGGRSLSPSVVVKDLVMDIRDFASHPALRPEYRFTSLEIKNSIAGDAYTSRLSADAAGLFVVDLGLDFSLPHEFFASGPAGGFSGFDYQRDLKLNSLSLNYTDHAFLDHVFEIAGLSGGREAAAEQLRETFWALGMVGGIDAERFAGEAVRFIAEPGNFEFRANADSPLSFAELQRNPFGAGMSLSINGGEPFTSAGY